MGKKGGAKKDVAKKEAKKARQEAKANKSAKKRAGKEAKASGEDDIDKILEEFAAQEAKKTEITVTPCPQPSPRANFTMTALPSGEMLLFGGEFFDGDRNTCYNELFRWNVEANAWRQISSPNSPLPRCSHQAALYRDHLYVIGGEFATAEQFYHHRDFWRFDIRTNAWERLELKGQAPSARSGHRAAVWRNHLVLFGGFYEAMRDMRWFGDLYLMNFQDLRWQKVEFPPTVMVPAPRSGCQLACHAATDTVFIYGGYSKVKEPGAKGEAKVHQDMWALNLKPVAAGGRPTIEKVSRKGKYPSARSGAAMTVHKNRAVLFGGVLDREGPQHTLESEFYNDLYAFDMDRRVWYNLRLKAKKEKGTRRRKKKGQEGGGGDDGDDDDEGNGSEEGEADPDDFALSDSDDDEEFKEDAFGYLDETGKMVYVEDEEAVQRKKEEEEARKAAQEAAAAAAAAATAEEEKGAAAGAPAPPTPGAAAAAPPAPPAAATRTAAAAAATKEREEGEGEKAPAPLPRINPCLTMRGARLYIYGGMLEIGDREVTLDDFWSLDLNQREAWACVAEGTMHLQEWKGEDDESTLDGYSDDEDDGEGSEGDFSEDEELYGGMRGGGGGGGAGGGREQEEKDELKEEEGSGGEEGEGKKKKKRDKDKKKSRRKGLREEIRELHSLLDLGDENTTPRSGESLRDFYARTTEYWAQELLRQGRARAEVAAQAADEARDGDGVAGSVEEESATSSSNEAATTDKLTMQFKDILKMEHGIRDDGELAAEEAERLQRERKRINWEEVPGMMEKELRKTAFLLAEQRFDELRPVLRRLAELEEEQQLEEKKRAKEKGKRSGKDNRR